MESLIITVTSSDEDTNAAFETDNYSDTDSDFGHWAQKEQTALFRLL